jgi:YVTN family beta-propeller protein/autotransporter-associated beta strand protein
LVAIVPLSVVLATPVHAGIDAYGLLTGMNSVPGAVFAFSTLTNTTTGSAVTVGSGPQNAVFTPDGRYAYVVSAGSNTVTVLDVGTRTIVATVAVGSVPEAIAISADGKFVYVPNLDSNRVSVISTAANQVVSSISAPSPYAVAVSPDGGTLYVTSFYGGTTSIIDAASGTTLKSISVGTNPIAVVASRDGSKVYVLNEAGTVAVTVIDTASRTIAATIPLSVNGLCLAVSPDGTRLYATNWSGELIVIDTTSNSIITTKPIPNGAVGVTVSPDGSRIYVSTGIGATVLDAATNNIIGAVSTPITNNLNFGTGWIGPNVIVATGGAVSAGSDAALAALGFDQYVIFNGGTLQLGGSFSTAKTISLLGQGGVIDTNGYNLTLSGTIINNGLLTKAGLGTLTLTGANTYTGGTLVSGGLINFSAANNFGTGAITLDGGGLQWATGTSTDISSRLAGIGVGGGTFDTNGNNVSFATGFAGTGSVTKAGAGTLTFAGANTYTGATLITSGTLALSGAGSIAASSAVGVATGASFDISAAASDVTITTLAGVPGSNVNLGSRNLTLSNASTTFAGQIAGSGGLSIAGGTQTLGGTNSYTGGTTVWAGTLEIGHAGAVGSGAITLAEGTTLSFIWGNYTLNNAISISGDPAFAPAAGTVQTLTGIIADGTSPGTLEMTGPGKLVLATANTYTGATLIGAGTLALSGTGGIAASSGVSVAAGAIFDISATAAGASITTLAGPGNVALGSQTLTLSKASTTFAGVIGGTGGLTLAGGTQTLSGTSNYTGPTSINAGTLFVSGSIASSATTVNAGGTLAGTGTVGNVTVGSGGTLAPGSGVAGTSLSIAGSLAFQSGALYQIQVNPSAASLANVSGAATLAGTVQAVLAPGSYLTKTYTILTAASRSGTFDGLTTSGLPAGFQARLDYSVPNSVMLDLQAGLGGTDGLNLNQRRVANSLNNYFNAGGSLPPAFVGLFGLSGSQLGSALSQLSGEAATGAQQSAFQMGTAFLGLMTDPFVDGRAEAEEAGALGYAPVIAA